MSAQTVGKAAERPDARGFTLIEIIITLVLLGFMAAMFSTLFSRAFTESSTPLVRLDQDVELASVMENMIADYKNPIAPKTLTVMNSAIGSAMSDQNNNYGVYRVVDNKYIAFDASGNEIDDTTGTNNILKVTIQSTQAGNAQTLTYLFTE